MNMDDGVLKTTRTRSESKDLHPVVCKTDDFTNDIIWPDVDIAESESIMTFGMSSKSVRIEPYIEPWALPSWYRALRRLSWYCQNEKVDEKQRKIVSRR